MKESIVVNTSPGGRARPMLCEVIKKTIVNLNQTSVVLRKNTSKRHPTPSM